ncbi:hypothetical protein DXG01_015642 [Tephrocybe rancida]|nr:hypothetical protein DXG01_015642 [Tephrocybe rancida]
MAGAIYKQVHFAAAFPPSVMLLERTFSLSNFTYGLTYGRIAGLSMVFCGLFSFKYFLQRFKGLRAALERRNSEVSVLRRELTDARSDIREKEEALAAHLKEVEDGKRRLVEKDGSLREAQKNHQALATQLGHRDRELRRREEELQQHKHEHALTVQLLETRTLELKGAEAFLTKADILSGADVIALVNTLNSEIYQTAAMVAEAFEFKAKEEGAKEEDEDGMAEVYASATDMVGPQMVEMLKSSGHREDPTIVQIAFQAAMAAYSHWIVRTWNLEDPDNDIGVSKVYKGIRDAEEQAVSGRWRALTRKYLPNTAEHELSLLFVDAFVNILLVADAVMIHAELQKAIETRFAERVSIIVKGAQRLRKAIGEEVTSCDFEVLFVNYDTPFSPAQMDDAFVSGFEKGREEPEPVLCATELGLEKNERQPGKEGSWESIVLVRPKIALKSGIEDMVSSMGNTP